MVLHSFLRFHCMQWKEVKRAVASACDEVLSTKAFYTTMEYDWPNKC